MARGGRSERWVEWLSAILLGLTLAYGVNGIPELDRERVLATDYVNPLNRWIWLGLLTLALPVLAKRWRSVLQLARASWPILCLYGYFALSTTWALDPGASTRRLLLAIVQLFLLAILLCGLKRTTTTHLLLIGVCVISAVADLATWVVMPGYAMTDEGFAGLQLQKNQTGLMMMLGCLAAGTGYFLRRDWFWRIGIGGSVLLMAALLVATRSTTSQSIILMVPFVIPAILAVAMQPKRAIWAIALSVMAGLLGLLFVYLLWADLSGRDPLLPLRGVTFTARTDLWSFLLDEIAKRPWLGVGYASMWAIDPSVQPSLKTGLWFGTDVLINEGHDGYLDLLATAGIVGFVGALMVVFRTLGIAARAIAQAAPAAQAWKDGSLAHPTSVFHFALLVGLLVHNFTESNLFSNSSVLAVAFVLAALDLERWRLTHDANAIAQRSVTIFRTRGPTPSAVMRPRAQ